MSKLRRKFITVLAVLLCAMLSLSAAFLIPDKSANAERLPDSQWTIIGSADNDIYLDNAINGKVFNGNLLSDLYMALTGEATIDGVERVLNGSSSIADNGDRVLTSADFRTQQGGTKNVSVWFGGVKWDVVYMTKDRGGSNIVLDLWQSADGANTINEGQSSPERGTSNLSTSLFQNHATYNYWTAFPSHMYSVSVVRVEALNAGGYTSWNENILDTTKKNQNTSNLYAKFTMDDPGTGVDSLIKYIVKPADVAYQETENNYGNSSTQYSLVNEAYGLDITQYDGTVNFYDENFKYYTSKGDDSYPESKYDNWKNDYLWLPSLAETGDTVNKNGIWKTNTDLRSPALSACWLRSGSEQVTAQVLSINMSGEYAGGTNVSYVPFFVRPALHLNLTKADENSIRALTVGDVSSVYNGKAQDLSSLTIKPSWYKEEIFTDNSKIKVEYVGDMTDVGEYTVKVTLLDTEKYCWADNNTSSDTRTFKYKITRAPLNVQKLQVDENGKLLGDGSVNDIITGTYLSTSLFERDVGKSTAPRFGVQYRRVNGGSWSTAVPEAAGQYYVRAYIINDNDTCNYYLASDGQTTFTKPKEYVETPHFTQDGIEANQIVGSTTTVQYTGDYQEFKLVNTPDDKLVGVTIGERTGGLSYDQRTQTFRAKAVGIYTVEALLEDGGANTQWDSSAEEISRTITLIITKAELTVNILESDMTSWTKGDIDYLTVQVEGVRNSENVKLDVYYTVTGNNNKTYVADSAMNLNEAGDTIIVTVNLATFDTNKEYQLFVSLRDNIAVNDNYTIVNNSEPYKFFIMTATINDDEIVGEWTISNLISGTKEATNGIEVDYNGSAYTLALDESKLPKGFEFNYTNESFTDVKQDGDGFYTTKVILTCQSGYQLASGKSSLSFEITWKINPIEFDVAFLIWADNPEWNDNKTLTMNIINLPVWLTEDYVSFSGNEEKLVNSYTATCVLYSDGNYTFIYSGSDSAHYTIDGDGLLATITHDWQITKRIINVTNAPKQWTTEAVTYQADDTYYYYNIYVPAGIEDKYLKVTYYSDSGLNSEVEDIRQITVDYSESKTYYIKIEIADDWASTCELYNTLTKGNFASTSFRVGGDMEIIEVTYDSPEEFMYDGRSHGITARYRDLQFTYKYYKLGEESPLEGEPTEVGDYRVIIAVDGDETSYWIQNSVFYFSITPLVLTTDGYKPATGNQLKESFVISDADVDTSEYFRYEVYNENGKVNYPTESLKFNTTYTVKLVLIKPECSVWADDAVTTYIFTTSFDPNAETKYLNDPTITASDKDGNTVKGDSVVWTGEEFTVTVNDWEALRSYVIVTFDGEEKDSGTFTFTDVGIYTITITIKEEALQAGAAEWLWDNGSASKTVTFEITKRYVAIPTANGEVQYTGETLYLFPDGYEEQFIKVNDGAVLSAVEIGGEWRVKLWLKDKENTCWADGTTEDKTFTWSIVKASVNGTWVIKDGYAQFVPDDEVYADKFTTTYYDADGNEVAVEDMAEGENYTAKITVKDEYAGKCEFADGVKTEYEFTYGELSTDGPNGGDEDLAKKKQEAKDALEEAARKKKEEIDNDPNMTDEEKQAAKDKVDEELQKGLAAIDGATTADGIDSSFGEAKKNIEDITAESGESPFPWWILAIIAGALLFLILLIIIIVKRRNSDDDEGGYDDFYDDEYDYDEEEEVDDDGDEAYGY